MLTLGKDYSSITTFIDLEVALPPLVSLSLPAVPKSNTSSISLPSVPKSIALLDGQDYNFTCTARRVFPRPVFYWTVDYKYSPQIQPVHAQPFITMEPSSYYITSYQTITLSSSTMLNNTLLTCHVTQHHKRTGRTLGRTNKSVRLLVTPGLALPVPAPGHADVPLGVIILVAVFLSALAGKLDKLKNFVL